MSLRQHVCAARGTRAAQTSWKSQSLQVLELMDNALQIFLPLYFLLFIAATFVWRPVMVWRATGVNPFVATRGDSAHDFVVRMFRIVVSLALAAVIIYAFAPQFYEYLAPILWLEHALLVSGGLILLLASLVWTVLAQIQMGNSLRIGIDKANKTALVQTGIFGISRNPIFLGLVAALVGLFLVIPNALTLLVLVMSVALIGVQVRLEEEFLTRVHGDVYREYTHRVRRWI